MRVSLGILFVAAAEACAPVGQASPADAEARDEAAVYAVVIDAVLATDSVLASTEAPFVVMAESTLLIGVRSEEVARRVRKLDPAFPAAAVADFEAKNRVSLPIPLNLPSRTKVRTFSPLRYRPAESDSGLERFRREYAPVTTYHALSRPGFDATRRHAVITVASGCGGLCGQGQVVLLARGSRGWCVTARDTIWWS
jgi:hypothetical protein